MRRLILLCVLALACAAPAAAVIGGEFDAENRYSFVGMVSDADTVCTGVLLSPTVFLTAAHCFPDAGPLGTDEEGNPIVGVTFNPAPPPHSITLFGSVHNDPDFCMDCGRGRAGVMQHDLAVVVLDEPQPGPYASLPKLNLTERLQKKMPLTLVGYGAIAGDRKRQPLQVFQRFVGEGELKNLGGRIDDFFIGLSGKKDVATPCFGDSGGPDLLPGTTTVVGLTSWANNVKTCLGKSFSYRLDTAESLAFIGQYLNP